MISDSSTTQQQDIEPLQDQLAQMLGRALARRRLRAHLDVPAGLDPAASSPDLAASDPAEELTS